MLAGMDPWGWQLSVSVVPITTLFGLCFGAWMGGIFGISLRNHHLRPFWREVEKGQYLVMVDADDDAQAGRIVRVMKDSHGEAREVGREDSFSPFD